MALAKLFNRRMIPYSARKTIKGIEMIPKKFVKKIFVFGIEHAMDEVSISKKLKYEDIYFVTNLPFCEVLEAA